MTDPGYDRKDLRIPILVTKVKGDDKGNVFFGYAKNISKAGLFIQTINPKDEQEQFKIEFTLPEDEKTIICEAEVVWKRLYLPNASFEPGMGLKFLNLDEETASYIDTWVDRAKED
ncbi:MAG: PilZ domain-containing protein [Proteobacteria bacterium]|nr:PilZ domain-containing protein [Pseudomonadota bacterium]